MVLKPDPLYKSYMQSLMPYERLTNPANKDLLALKLKEAVLILLQANPALAEVLFDFSEPGKIDLEAFMNENFHFNVKLKRFAYLTGEAWLPSSAILKRSSIFLPSRWLQRRRLQEAHYLISEKGLPLQIFTWNWGLKTCRIFSFAFREDVWGGAVENSQQIHQSTVEQLTVVG